MTALAVILVALVVAFTGYAFIRVGADYRAPLTEADIRRMNEEAERAASLAEGR